MYNMQPDILPLHLAFACRPAVTILIKTASYHDKDSCDGQSASLHYIKVI